MMKNVIGAAGFCLLALVGFDARAQEFPSQTVTLVVPFAAGNSTDILSRLLADKMSVEFGQPVVVENHPGGGGMIGAAVAARSAPDGHTILISTNSIQVAAPLLMQNLPIDPIESFDPVTLLAEISQLVLVSENSPAQTFEELIELAHSDGNLSYAAPNTISQYAAELLKLRTGIPLVAIPYTSTQQALTDLGNGDVDIGFIGYTTANPHIERGAIRALASTTRERMSHLPDVPVVADTVDDYFTAAWIAAFVPAGTPQDVVDTLNGAFHRALADPELVERMDQLAILARPSTPAELDEYVAADAATWKEVAEAAGWEAQ